MTAPTDAHAERDRLLDQIRACCTQDEVSAFASSERSALARLAEADPLAATDVRNLAAQRRIWIDRGWVRPGQPDPTPYTGPDPRQRRAGV